MRLQSANNKIVCYLRYFAVYLLLLASNGFYIYAQGFRVPLMLCAAGLYFVLSQWKLDLKLLIMVMILVAIVSVSGLTNDETIRNIVVPLMDFVGAALVAFGALGGKKGEFLNIYRRVVLALAVGSVIVFILGDVANSLFRVFPMFTQGRHDAYFAVISFVYRKRQYLQYRNLGICWEPGAFQTYLILAMILEERINCSHKLRNLILLSITIITTASTTGIICMMLFWLLYAVKSPKQNKGMIILLAIMTIVLLILVNPEILPQELYFGVIQKISDVLSGNRDLQTVQTRMDSIVYPLQAFLENPLFGVGKVGMRRWQSITGHGMNTCTPINWFTHYGVFMGVILLFGFWRFFAKINRRQWVGLFMLGIFLVAIATEAFNYNPSLLCLAMMGLSGKTDLLPEEEEYENTPD